MSQRLITVTMHYAVDKQQNIETVYRNTSDR